jgi:hypothetical protein
MPQPDKPASYIHPTFAPTYYELLHARRMNREELLLDRTGGIPSSAVFFWDTNKNQLINPINLIPDQNIKSANYLLQADLYSFHSSKSDMQTHFGGNSNNVQIDFRAKATQSGEDYLWIVTAGLNIADQFLGGKDQQSISLSNSANQLTNFSSQDQIVIADGEVSLWIGLNVHKKDGWWDTFLKAIHMITNSPLFALVPMAKLASEAVDAVTQMTQQIEKQNHLTTILQGNRLDFRLYDGTSQNPFCLKPGFWVIMNYDQAKKYIDYTDKENIKKGVILDIGSQQYDVIDTTANNDPIDVTYAVARFKLPPKSGS